MKLIRYKELNIYPWDKNKTYNYQQNYLLKKIIEQWKS